MGNEVIVQYTCYTVIVSRLTRRSYIHVKGGTTYLIIARFQYRKARFPRVSQVTFYV